MYCRFASATQMRVIDIGYAINMDKRLASWLGFSKISEKAKGLSSLVNVKCTYSRMTRFSDLI